MKHVLAKAHRPILEQFAWSRVLLGFDFDGTLAPIVREPDAARMRRRTRDLLVAVASRYPTAVISGRGREDVQRRLTGVPLVAVVGNHGLEPAEVEDRCPAAVRSWISILHARLAGAQGIVIEDKGLSIAVHYRRSRSRGAARRLIDEAARALGDGARIVSGKLVVNVLPEGAPHKGFALQRLRAQTQADTAVFIGDDTTDEDVFTLDEPGRLLSIRVGKSASTAAPYFLHAQREIDDLLEALVALRPERAAALRGCDA